MSNFNWATMVPGNKKKTTKHKTKSVQQTSFLLKFLILLQNNKTGLFKCSVNLWWAWVSSALKKVSSYQLETCTDLHRWVYPPPKTHFIFLKESTTTKSKILYLCINLHTCLKKLVIVSVAGLKPVRLQASSPLVVLSKERLPMMLEFLRSDHEPFLSANKKQ